MMIESTVYLDDHDRELISLLQYDTRASYQELGEAVNISASTARRRIERLVNEGALKLIAVPVWAKLGFTLTAFVGISVELQHLPKVGDAFAEMDEVTWVAMTSGVYDLFAQINLPRNEDLTTFITERIAVITGIREIETIMVPRFVKTFDEYRLPVKPNPLYGPENGRRKEEVSV